MVESQVSTEAQPAGVAVEESIAPEAAQDTAQEQQVIKQPKEDPAIIELREKRNVLKGKLMTLQWDVDHGQINPGKKVQYEKLKKEFEEVEKLLHSPK